MRSEIIISTYNAPRALHLTLHALKKQVVMPDSVCVADDGSGAETRDVIDAFKAVYPDLPIRHVWHEDQGFRKSVILNRAAQSAEMEHLIFTDGDCLVAPGFVQRHRALAAPDRFCSGSLIRLSEAATDALSLDDVESGRVWDRAWLKRQGTFDRTTTWLKAMPFPQPIQAAMDQLYPIRITFMGSNASAFREALLAVNGFDETMAYGVSDKEFGIRLSNSGVKGRRVRFTTPVVHQDHPRGYRDEAAIKRQRAMIRDARETRKTWTEAGVQPGPRRT